ncbi:MAG: GNAT family N-acetyltransferase [Microlunatus sp.]|nr:GNAT family N-acetyltransferase [Microlunatus sp.]
MLAEIHPPDSAGVAPLLTGLDHQLSAAAVLAGTMPGEVLVDDAAKPTSVFVSSPEGIFVGGNPTDAFAAGVRERLAATYRHERDGDLVVSFDHDGWNRLATAIVPELALFRVPRRHYLLQADQPRRRPSPPPGVRIVPIDAALLRHPRLPDHVQSWIDGNWGGEKNFLARGFGVAAVQDDMIVSWSVADCVVADRAEIGIHTVPEYRRRGLATQVTAAAVTDAFRRGLTQVGWHCNEDNPGSYRTAEAVGFSLRRHYNYAAYTPRGR